MHVHVYYCMAIYTPYPNYLSTTYNSTLEVITVPYHVKCMYTLCTELQIHSVRILTILMNVLFILCTDPPFTFEYIFPRLLMNIESSHKLTRSGDTASGCIEGVNMEDYQVLVQKIYIVTIIIYTYQIPLIRLLVNNYYVDLYSFILISLQY